MKQFLRAILIVCLLSAGAFAAEEGRFFRYPSVHGDKIVFTYEGDLWPVSAQGRHGLSPDDVPGRRDVRQVLAGREMDRLHRDLRRSPGRLSDAGRGRRARAPQLQSRRGPGRGLDPGRDRRRLPIAFRERRRPRSQPLHRERQGRRARRFPLDRGLLVSFIAATATSSSTARRGNEEYYWKRYKGGQYQDIWLYDAAAKTYTPVSDYVGKNAYPMWIGDTMYFVSDRGSGIANLFAQKIGTKDAKPVTTNGDFDVMMPNTDGRTIVYVQDGRIHVFNVKSNQRRQDHGHGAHPTAGRLRNRVDQPPRLHPQRDRGDDGKSVVLEARGDVFAVPAGRGASLNLSQTPGTREMFPAVSPDGKTVAFFSDKSGADYQLYTQKVEGGAWTQITTGLDRAVYRLAWSPDGKKILFGNKDYAIFIVDVATKKLAKIDSSNQMKNDEFIWEIADYAWSPDSKWIAYSFVQANRNSQIFLYSLSPGQEIRRDGRFLRQPLPLVRRQRQIPLLRFQP